MTHFANRIIMKHIIAYYKNMFLYSYFMHVLIDGNIVSEKFSKEKQFLYFG